MKPYRETHEFEGMLDAPVERVWELHTSPEQMCSVFSWILNAEIVAGSPGEKGCGYRMDMRSNRGRARAVWFKVIDTRAPRSITVRSRIPTQSPFKRLRVVIQETTRTLKRRGRRTVTTVVISMETVPIRWLVRILLRATRKGRARKAATDFDKAIAEENAFYASLGS